MMVVDSKSPRKSEPHFLLLDTVLKGAHDQAFAPT